MTNPAPSPFAFVRTFNPVFTRNRHDGWKPAKQIAFINALAESGCVADACRRVGMSTESAYALKRRYDAIDFRLTWEAALDYAVKRLSDAALSRAIHGVPVPRYYKGEVVGEHRHYNETLTMFILRYRDPVTYAKSWDRRDIVKGHPEQEAEQLAVGIDNILTDNSRRYCEANHAREQAAAYAEDDIRILNERREIAYQAHIKAEDAAKAAAAVIEAAAAARVDAEEVAAALAREAEDIASAAARRAREAAARTAGDVRDAAAGASGGLELDSSVVSHPDRASEAPAIYDETSGPVGGKSEESNAFCPDVASGSSTSSGSAVPTEARPPVPAMSFHPDGPDAGEAAAALGYRVVTLATSSPPGRPPYWAQRIL